MRKLLLSLAALLLVVLLCACGGAEPDRSVSVMIEEGPGFTVDNNPQRVAPGEDAVFELVLEEDVMTLSSVGPEEEMESREQTRLVQAAVNAMTEPDREIFIRYYYYCQRATAIAREMNMSPSAVRQRLKRGRGRLREELMKGGDLFEAAYF